MILKTTLSCVLTNLKCRIGVTAHEDDFIFLPTLKVLIPGVAPLRPPGVLCHEGAGLARPQQTRPGQEGAQVDAGEVTGNSLV